MDILPLVLLLGVGIIAASGVRVLGETERFAVSAAGRFLKLVGPGLIYRFPGTLKQWIRIRIGDVGAYRGDGLAEFRGAVVPVTASSAKTNDAVQITAFREGKVQVSPATQRIVVCEKCGHENRVAV